MLLEAKHICTQRIRGRKNGMACRFDPYLNAHDSMGVKDNRSSHGEEEEYCLYLPEACENYVKTNHLLHTVMDQ